MVILDFHVHLYDCYDLGSVLTAAYDSLHQIKDDRVGMKADRVLLLAESAGYDRFGELKKSGVPNSEWRVERTGELYSLCCLNGEKIIYIVRGRQINTSERLEVLALCTGADIKDGLSLEATVRTVGAEGGIAVLPWGAGKWFGRRGRILYKFLERTREKVFLGDNGGRPVGWPEPEHFHLAREKQIPILPGSDSLPLPGEEKRVGSYGGIVDIQLNSDTVAATLTQTFLQYPEVKTVGYRLSPATFLLRRLRMRLSGTAAC